MQSGRAERYEELPSVDTGGPVHNGETATDESSFVETARFRVCPREGLYGIQVPKDAWHSVVVHENKYEDIDFKIFNEEDLWDFDIEQLDNYSKLRLIVDFVASMTDKYSVELYQKFAGMRM